MIALYASTMLLSIVLFAISFRKFYESEKSLVGLFLSVMITNIGYFLLSISNNITFALIFNSVAYLGSVMLPVFAIVMVTKANKLKVKKEVNIILALISTIVFVIAASPLFSDVYYKDVSLSKLGNATILIKTYGVLHPIYKIYIIAALLIMLCIIIICFVKNRKESLFTSMFLTFVVMINVGVWIVENILDIHFELVSVSYILTEVLILLLYRILKEFIDETQVNIPQFENDQKQSVKHILTEEEIDSIFKNDNLDILTKREYEVAKLLVLDVKRKDIATKLFISESTAKKHCSNVYKKLEVTNRKELKEKIISIKESDN